MGACVCVSVCVCVAVTGLRWYSRSRLNVLSPGDTGWLRGFVAFNGSVGQRSFAGCSTSDHGRPILLWIGDPLLNQRLLYTLYLDCISQRIQFEMHHTHQPMQSLQCTLNPLCLAFCLYTSVFLFFSVCSVVFFFLSLTFLLCALCFSRLPLLLCFFIPDCFSVVVSVSNIHIHTAFSVSLPLCQTLSAI